VSDKTKVAIGIICGVIIVSGVLMLLWNWLMPNIFGLPEINIVEALGIMVLFTMLFNRLDVSRLGNKQTDTKSP
jgi:hypothetical protein